MNILVTGANGFIGKNLVATLKNIHSGKDKTNSYIKIKNIYACDADTPADLFDAYCGNADFVFHLAGVNRPDNDADFSLNHTVTFSLLNKLKKHHNHCPVMYASSSHALLSENHNHAYGSSKRLAEDLLFSHATETGAKVLVYRFPNVFGKWCKPNYNSVVATFCYNMAHDLPICVENPNAVVELLYIDDLVHEMLAAIQGREHRTDNFCYVPVTQYITLGEIAKLLYCFKEFTKTLMVPQQLEDSFPNKLLATYLSYLPSQDISVPLHTHEDHRGSFTELLRPSYGNQLSVNIAEPGITKGVHWHHSKCEIFVVVSGEGIVRQRKIGTDQVIEHNVSGNSMEAIFILPGYTHCITNLSENTKLIFLVWSNETFDANRPDTYHEKV